MIAIIFGFLAGFLAQTVGSLYFFSNYGLVPNESGLISLMGRSGKSANLRQVLDYRMAEDFSQSLVSVYIKKQGGQDVLSQAYLPSELKGQGVVLTSDGWILTVKEAVKNLSAGQLAIVLDQKDYSVDKVVFDDASGVAFVHAVKTDNRNWPVVKINNQTELQVGQAVLAFGSSQEVILSNLKTLDYNPVITAINYIKSAEVFSKYLLITNELNTGYLGSPVVNLSGEVIGLVSSTQPGEGTKVIPAGHFVNAVNSALKDGQAKRPFLGVNYVDLSQLAGVDKITGLNEHQLTRGALLYGSPAVIANSPAAKAGLIRGDVIIKVDNEQVNQLQDLTDFIQEFQPGQTLKLIILRDGVDKEIEVTLG